MKKPLTFLLSLAITSPLIAAAEETACLQTNETPLEIISCLDKRGIDLTVQRDKLYQAQIDTLQNRISYLETLIQLQQRQLDALKRDIYQLPQSCQNIQQQQPTKVTGLYSIDVDGAQGEMPLNIYCNMDLHGGGWSLIYATNPDQEEFKSAKQVTPRSARYLPAPLVRALAAHATEILIIDADNPSNFIKSTDDFPIKRLRALQNLNDPDEPRRVASAHWQGSEHDRTMYRCDASSEGYPTVIYRANCNRYGLHLDNQGSSRFNYSSSNHPISVYLR